MQGFCVLLPKYRSYIGDCSERVFKLIRNSEDEFNENVQIESVSLLNSWPRIIKVLTTDHEVCYFVIHSFRLRILLEII